MIKIKLNEHLEMSLIQLKETFCADGYCTYIVIEDDTKYPCELCDCPIFKFIDYITNKSVW